MTTTTCPKCGQPALPFDVQIAGECGACIKETAATLTNWQSHPQRITNQDGNHYSPLL